MQRFTRGIVVVVLGIVASAPVRAGTLQVPAAPGTCQVLMVGSGTKDARPPLDQ